MMVVCAYDRMSCSLHFYRSSVPDAETQLNVGGYAHPQRDGSGGDLSRHIQYSR